MLGGTSGALCLKLLLQALPIFDYLYRVFSLDLIATYCFNFHPFFRKAEIFYLAFHTHQYHELSNPSPVELSVSTWKFSSFSFHRVLIPVNSSTPIPQCCAFLSRPLQAATVLTQEAALHHTVVIFTCSLIGWTCFLVQKHFRWLC